MLMHVILFGQVTKIYDFNSSVSGKEPLGGLITDGTFLFGMTQWGGTNDKGVVFKIKPDGTSHSVLVNFDGLNGDQPHGDLVLVNNQLFGATTKGGTHNEGVIFKVNSDGSNFSIIYNFIQASVEHMIVDGNVLYGSSMSADNDSINGSGEVGFIFKINTDGTSFTKLYQFTGTTGSILKGKLLKIGDYLYGVTAYGGSFANGIIYKIKKDGTDFSVVYNSEQQGLNSIITDGTSLYCTTDFGGNPSGNGSILKVNLDGTGFQMLKNFDESVGSEPSGNLFLVNSTLYGMTNNGGTQGAGTIYKINTDGTNFSTIHNCSLFGGNLGTNPRGGFVSINNYIYGLMQMGGVNYNGTIFKYQYNSTGISNVLDDLNIQILPNPASENLFVDAEVQFEKYDIINSVGEIIVGDKMFNSNSISINDLPNGQYFILLKSKSNKTISKSFIVAH